MEKHVLKRIQQKNPSQFLTSILYDEESTSMGSWKEINPSNRWKLTKNCKMKHKLAFYPYAKYEFTYNERHKFHQGQLALLMELLTTQQIEAKEDITVWVAPPSLKSFPSLENLSIEHLQQNNWYQVKVPFTTSPSTDLHRGISG